MRNLKPAIHYIVLTGLLLLLFSCAPDSCFDVTESFVKASFYDNVTKKMRAPDSLTLYGINMDTNLVYSKKSNIQPALIPMDASASGCRFIIKINGLTDTLEFSYNSYPHLVSKECGYTFYYNLTDTPRYSKNAIDYIYLTNRNITTVNEENIRIFY
jgi:hypothetical protein